MRYKSLTLNHTRNQNHSVDNMNNQSSEPTSECQNGRQSPTQTKALINTMMMKMGANLNLNLQHQNP